MQMFLILFFVLFQASSAQNKKIDLKDIKIQGQGLDQSKLDLSKKDRTDVEKHLKIRKNFRKEILMDLPPELRSEKKKKKK